MKAFTISSFFVLFALVLVISLTQAAFADHSEVTIVSAAGSGAPGCEETADGCYIPSTATVDVGGVVIMTNTDSAAHTYTSGTPDGGPDGVFDTSLLMVNSSFEWNPMTVGEQPYFCMVHPWMIGLIVVQEAGTDEMIEEGTHEEEEMYIEDNTNMIILTDIDFVNSFGVPVQKIVKDASVQVSANLKNTQQFDVPFSYIVEIEDESGEVISKWVSGEISGSKTFNASVSWIPSERGTHTITIKVLDKPGSTILLSKSITLIVNVLDNSLPSPKFKTVTDNENDKYNLSFYTDSEIISVKFIEEQKMLNVNLRNTSGDFGSVVMEIPRDLLDGIYDVRHLGKSIPFSLNTTLSKNIITIPGNFNPEVSILGAHTSIGEEIFLGYSLNYWWGSGLGDNDNVDREITNMLDLHFRHEQENIVKSTFEVSIPNTNFREKFSSTSLGLASIQIPANTFTHGNPDNPVKYEVNIDVIQINDSKESPKSIRITTVVVPEFPPWSIVFILSVMFGVTILISKTNVFSFNKI